jgi:hypothetical protein
MPGSILRDEHALRFLRTAGEEPIDLLTVLGLRAVRPERVPQSQQGRGVFRARSPDGGP